MKESVIYQKWTTEAEARGEERSKETIAKKMLTAGTDPAQIANLTGLSPERIRQLSSGS